MVQTINRGYGAGGVGQRGKQGRKRQEGGTSEDGTEASERDVDKVVSTLV